MLHVNHTPHMTEKTSKRCGRYFCNYCLKGSYKLNVDTMTITTTNVTATKTIHTASSATTIKDPKPHSKNSKANLIKDWCCPWCSNECFCSRCVREEQIFKLISTYFQYEGDLFDLYIELIKENPILNALKEDLIISSLEIQDLTHMDRHCKNLTNFNDLIADNSSTIPSKNKSKLIVLSKKGKQEKYASKKKQPSSTKSSHFSIKTLDRKNLEILDSKIDNYVKAIEAIDKQKYLFQVLQRKICKRVIDVGNPVEFNENFLDNSNIKANRSNKNKENSFLELKEEDEIPLTGKQFNMLMKEKRKYKKRKKVDKTNDSFNDSEHNISDDDDEDDEKIKNKKSPKKIKKQLKQKLNNRVKVYKLSVKPEINKKANTVKKAINIKKQKNSPVYKKYYTKKIKQTLTEGLSILKPKKRKYIKRNGDKETTEFLKRKRKKEN